jgi:hypothetical protein
MGYQTVLSRVEGASIMMFDIPNDWTPSAANINALPEPLRRYIHELKTVCDPAGMCRCCSD